VVPPPSRRDLFFPGGSHWDLKRGHSVALLHYHPTMKFIAVLLFTMFAHLTNAAQTPSGLQEVG